MKFADWFCLSNRNNFTIDPQINPADAHFYFGRNDIKERLQRQLGRAFIAPGVPKMMIYGPYGSGKTQTLFYLQYFLNHHTPASAHGKPHTLYLAIELRSNSNAAHWHMQILEALGKETVTNWVRQLFDMSANFDTALEGVTDDPNILLALKELRASGQSTFTAWRWLTGQILKSSELNTLRLTRNLTEVGAGDLVNVAIAIGTLADRVGSQLVFLMDELEELQNVKTGDAAESIHQYIRRLSEPVNSSVGFIIGFNAVVMDDAPEVLRRPDIMSRVALSNYVEIPALPAVTAVSVFVRELLSNLTDSARVGARIAEHNLSTEFGTFPFTLESLQLLADYAAQDPRHALPRYIITAINECAIQAWDDKKPTIDEATVNSVAQYVFAEP